MFTEGETRQKARGCVMNEFKKITYSPRANPAIEAAGNLAADLDKIVDRYAPSKEAGIESELLLISSIAANLKYCKFFQVEADE